MSNEENHETPKAGKIAQDFDIVLNKYISGTIRAAVSPEMKEMLESVIPECTEAIDECYVQGKDYIKTNLKAGVRQIIADAQLVEKQNELQDMLADAEKRERVRTLVPTPYQVSTGIVHKAKKDEVIRLQKMLDDITEENYKIMNAISKGMKEKRQKELKLDSYINQFTKSIISTSSIPTEDLIEAEL